MATSMCPFPVVAQPMSGLHVGVGVRAPSTEGHDVIHGRTDAPPTLGISQSTAQLADPVIALEYHAPIDSLDGRSTLAPRSPSRCTGVSLRLECWVGPPCLAITLRAFLGGLRVPPVCIGERRAPCVPVCGIPGSHQLPLPVLIRSSVCGTARFELRVVPSPQVPRTVGCLPGRGVLVRHQLRSATSRPPLVLAGAGAVDAAPGPPIVVDGGWTSSPQ